MEQNQDPQDQHRTGRERTDPQVGAALSGQIRQKALTLSDLIRHVSSNHLITQKDFAPIEQDLAQSATFTP